jgi:hypothetical protein
MTVKMYRKINARPMSIRNLFYNNSVRNDNIWYIVFGKIDFWKKIYRQVKLREIFVGHT